MAKKKSDKTNKSWGGRFESATDSLVEDFTASIHFDRELALFDIQQSIAHSAMLCECGIISKKDMTAIHNGLKAISEEISSGKFKFSKKLEDVHMNVESRLAEIAGDAAGRLHTARSRNDQVVTDLKLYLRASINEIIAAIRKAQAALVAQAKKHTDTIMPGYTHLQRAQPVLLGHHLMAYFFMLDRDAGRFRDCAARMDFLPLGAGALAGSALPTDPRITAKKLGFSNVLDNSIDAVADRDFLVEYLAACNILMNHLSRSCEEFIIWMSSEFKFVDFPDALCTGSSIMPQKKNPDVAELIRGKTGRVCGSLVSLIVTLKALPLAYNRDLQEDKEPAFDAARTVAASLGVYEKLVKGAKFNTIRLREAVQDGYLNAVDLTDYLVAKGVPFRETHHIAGRLVKKAIDAGKRLEELSLEELKAESHKFDKDVYEAIKPETAVKKRSGAGAASPAEVKKQIRKAEKILERAQ